MKKIAYITSAKVGLHRFTYNEIIALNERGIDFILCLTQLKKGPCMPMENWKYFTASWINSLITFFSLLFAKRGIINLFFEAQRNGVIPYYFIALSFYKDIKNSEITSIHCQMGDRKLYIGYFLKKILKKPLSVTVHAHELYQRDVYDRNDQIRNLYAYCDKVLTISDFNYSIINEKFGVDRDKMQVMRLFPDIDNLNYVKNKIKILIVANWVEKKGYDVLLNAIKKIKRDDFVLWVVGGSNLDHDAIDVNELVDKYDVRNKVAILGRQGSPMLDIIFNSCDFFCLPSYTDYYSDGNPSEREGIPVALMEAMAWGKPVIATNHSGNSELVSDILVEEKDVDGLSSAITYLIENKDKWPEMGRKNKEIIQKKFSESNIDKLITTFKSF